jgi:hypothetical protein
MNFSLHRAKCQIPAFRVEKKLREGCKSLYIFFGRKKNFTSLGIGDLSVSIAFDFKDYLLSGSADRQKIEVTEPSALGNVKKFRIIFDGAIDIRSKRSNETKGKCKKFVPVSWLQA